MPSPALEAAIKAEAIAQAAYFAAADAHMKAQKAVADSAAALDLAKNTLDKAQAAYAKATATRIASGG